MAARQLKDVTIVQGTEATCGSALLGLLALLLARKAKLRIERTLGRIACGLGLVHLRVELLRVLERLQRIRVRLRGAIARSARLIGLGLVGGDILGPAAGCRSASG